MSTPLAVVSGTEIEALNGAEQGRLRELESVVEKGIATFLEVGNALGAIRDERLYRETHGDFGSYLAARWNLGRAHAYRLIAAAEVVKSLSSPPGGESPTGDMEGPVILSMPTAESQVRPLVGLPTAEAREVYAEAERLAGGKAPTAALVKKAKADRKAPLTDVEAAIASGIIPANAVVEVSGGEAEEEDDTPARTDDDLTDAEWLARTEIQAVRDQLGELARSRFDEDALWFRHVTPFRLAFRSAVKPAKEAAKRRMNGHIGKYMLRFNRFMEIRDPSRWHPCSDPTDGCNGTGRMTLLGPCPTCRGQGYLIGDEYPT